MKNLDIRQEAKTAKVNLWQIAEQLGIADSNFSRKLRKELSVEEKKQNPRYHFRAVSKKISGLPQQEQNRQTENLTTTT